jgi:asparagine synthase (glutamine-hydrolysing)
MCGLAGIFHPDAGTGIDAALLRRMTTALAHRGPDGDGFHTEPGLGLGHRRLAIIDLAGGHQPMANEDGSVVIVFNGEIYNFADLRPQLQALGHVFRSDHSDTETIVHAWESWGPDCLQQLDGMFVFAVWDRNRGQLFLARDRLGKKPLYYAHTPDGAFVFGSEMAALAEVPALPRRISPTAVEDFFTWGYIPDPATIYAGIHRLPAAHFLLLERGLLERGLPERGRAPVPRRYWQPPTEIRPQDEAGATAELTARLQAATATRLVADVPLGAFLSGGVDSSAVVVTAARLRSTPLDTFTIGFDGAEDETRYAVMVSQRAGTVQHNERAAAVDMIEAARVQGRIFGEPFGDSSAVPTFSVCRLARRHATVAMSGDGGDEVFAGYRRYRWHMLVEAVRRCLPAPVRRHAIGALARAYPKLDRAPRWLRAKHTLTELSLDAALGYLSTMTQVHQARRRALLAPALLARLDGYDPTARIAALMEDCGSEDALLAAQHVDLATWLPGRMLVKVDRASMANALEVRAPLLDYRLAAWGLALPRQLKIHHGEGKYVLKRALEPYLPHDVLYRPKQGFATSLAGLFRREAARLRARLTGAALLDSGLFAPAAIGRLLREHETGQFDHSGALWLLLVFEGFLAAGPGCPPGGAGEAMAEGGAGHA